MQATTILDSTVIKYVEQFGIKSEIDSTSPRIQFNRDASIVAMLFTYGSGCRTQDALNIMRNDRKMFGLGEGEVTVMEWPLRFGKSNRDGSRRSQVSNYELY